MTRNLPTRPHACHCCGGSGEMRRGMICPLCKGTGRCLSCTQWFHHLF